MRYKKILMLTIFLVSVLFISAVSATENVTDDVVSMDDAIEVNLNEDVVSNTDLEDENATNSQNSLGSSESEYELSLNNELNVLSTNPPSSSDYSVSVYDTVINKGTSGTITANINSPCTKEGYHAYNFNIYIIDSSGNVRWERHWVSTSPVNSISAEINSDGFPLGTYTIKIENYLDNRVMSSAKLTIKLPSDPDPTSDSNDSDNPVKPHTRCELYPSVYPTFSNYSVSVDDISVSWGSGASISMKISPSSNSTSYRYYYTLEISGNDVMISKPYYGNIPVYSKTYTISPNLLSPGIYTIKIVNYGDDKVMAEASLTVEKYPFYSEYSVNVSDTSIPYGSSAATILMNISPSHGHWKYNYYLRIDNSRNGTAVFNQYASTDSTYSESCRVGAYHLAVGNYTIKIINAQDGKLMTTAKLTVNYYPSYLDYSVDISDTSINYGSFGWIPMTVHPSSSSTMVYSYYLKVYDSNNNEKISELYNSTTCDYNIFSYTIRQNPLSPGEYTVKIINYYDNEVMDTAKLTVNKTPTKIIVSNVTATYKDNSYLVVTLKDQRGNLIKGEKLSIDFNGIKSYTSDDNGQVKIPINGLNPKTYTATITFEGNDVLEKSTASAKVVVNKIKVSLSSQDISVVYNDDGCLVAYLKDNDGHPLEGVDVLVNLNGINSLTTDAEGQVILDTIGLDPKTYVATITFDGNAYYDKSTVNVNVVVKKATPKLTAKAKTFKKSVKTKKYTVTLKTNQNKVMKNTKLTLKVNGKTYSAKTNAKGQATFKITKLTKKGKFTAVVKFAGNKYYNAKTVNAKITVK